MFKCLIRPGSKETTLQQYEKVEGNLPKHIKADDSSLANEDNSDEVNVEIDESNLHAVKVEL